MNRAQTTALGAPLKVVYILGFARSGTTILSNILGEVDGFTHVGELDYLWQRMALKKGKCGCQTRVAQCPFWSRVITDVHDSLSRNNRRITEFTNGLDDFVSQVFELRTRALTVRSRRIFKRRLPELEEYADVMEHLYHSIARITGSNVLVDSSKLSEPAGLFRYMTSISPRFIHVVRDARGSILSRQRGRARRHGVKLRLNTFRSAMDGFRWMRENMKCSRIESSQDAYLHLKYEDFAVRPREMSERIVRFIGASEKDLPFIDERTVMLRPNHTVCGNKNRFQQGPVRISIDTTWRVAMRRSDLIFTTVLTSPILLKYRYPLFPLSADV